MRTALSARLDGEDAGVAERVLDAHVEACAGCRGWLDGAAAVSRRVRLHVPAAQTDLSAQVVQRLADAAVHERPPRRIARTALLVTALVQLLLSLPALVFAIGVLAPAWRPWRAAGMLPVVAALAVGLSATTIVDMVSGDVPAVGEVPHLLALVEAALLWRLRASGPAYGRPGAPEQRRLRLRSVA